MPPSSPDQPAVGEPANLPQAIPRRKTEVLISRLGALRDGLLLLAGVIYLLGYISWANYALMTRIGLVPALDAQYFTAGIVPAVIFFLFVLSVRVLRAFHRWLKRPASDKDRTVGKVLTWLAFAVTLVFVVLNLIFRKALPGWVSSLGFVFLALMMAGAFFGRGKEDRFMIKMGLFIIWSYTILGALWLILGYTIEVFPRLSAELGGPKPRCTQLDIDGSQISPETRLELRGNTTAAADQPVFRSAPVYLIFDGSDYVLLAERPDTLSPTNRVYRLRKDAVKGEFPCKSDETKSSVH